MPMHIVCPGCGKALEVPDHALGEQVRCSACQLQFAADAPGETVAAAGAKAAPIAETPLKPEKPPQAEPMPTEDAPTPRRTPGRKQSSGTMTLRSTHHG